MWYFDKSKIDDLQSQIQLQNNENERLQFEKNEFMKKIESLGNTVQVLKNDLRQKDFEMNIELINKDSKIQSQELELRKAVRMEEAAEKFIGKLDTWKRPAWQAEVILGWDCEVEQGKSIITNIMESPR